MTDFVFDLCFTAIQFLAFFKSNGNRFILKYADKSTKAYIGWSFLFWFCSGVITGRLFFRFIHWLIGG